MIVTVDTEFLDDGKTIELLSVGMVAENGDELYRIIRNADWYRAANYGDGWIRNHVLDQMPMILHEGGSNSFVIEWDHDHPDFRYVQLRDVVREDVENFLFDHANGLDGSINKVPDLWADHPATDHVALYQLFGPMVECTRHGMPMRTSCLAQEEVMLRRERPDWNGSYRPIQDPKTEHHALWDAKHDMDLARWLGLVS